MTRGGGVTHMKPDIDSDNYFTFCCDRCILYSERCHYVLHNCRVQLCLNCRSSIRAMVHLIEIAHLYTFRCAVTWAVWVKRVTLELYPELCRLLSANQYSISFMGDYLV